MAEIIGSSGKLVSIDPHVDIDTQVLPQPDGSIQIIETGFDKAFSDVIEELFVNKIATLIPEGGSKC